MSEKPALQWTDTDRRAVDTVRVLAMDAVEKVGNGHPGTAMSLAPVAYTLFQRFLRHDPTDPAWPGRDRFVLSAGHSSLTLYIQLYLSGYGLELDDLKQLRTWGSLTPGHPEHGHTAGVETTTGPLGQGVGNAVGMAMAARRERGLLDPDAAAGESPFDHTIWCIASDGDLQEGVSAEASSLAGHQQLGNLVVVWDHNSISIEDDTDIAFTEDVVARYEAYGWHTQFVEDGEDVQAVAAALEAARAETSRPSFIALKTVIGYPAPNKQGTGKIHGSALGADEVKATKELLGFDPLQSFEVSTEVLEHARDVVRRGREAHAAWQQRYDAWAAEAGDRLALHERMQQRRLPDGWTQALPVFPADPKGMATRKASGEVLSAIAPVLPELWGGSADLAESNNTTPKGEPSFVPAEHQTKEWQGGPYGRVLHFGIREHAMGAIMNGIALHGGTRVYGGTFLVFSDYMRPSVRLAALMQLPVTYVWTHDSIGLGEDGPTHQPIEQLAALRAIPGLDVVRPADANETAVAWRTILEHTDRPAGLALTRQNVPTLDREVLGSAEGTAKGAYVLAEASTALPQVVLIATGSEVQIALDAREQLESEGTPTRVVSMPCMEWFRAQDRAYQQQVLPPSAAARVSVEAGIAMPWREWVGEVGQTVSIEHFGASAPYTVLYEQFGFTRDRVVAAAHAALDKAGVIKGSTTGN
ncbi:transketolase [Vallicoccus soli]|uniref:Transketolase n=1 Tax=Vallicoccus soli TaxID=2339232 RepID=A0A3A3YXH0_9ACTN|nr:transketolase [Vallicoccus soli]RJK93763.1 transketolase [Vallicoccus soli]